MQASARLRLLSKTRVWLAAAVTLLVVPASVRALCTPEDLSSKNAEKCAKRYAVALLKCMKKGTPLSSCDTSKAAPYCDALSTACTPATQIDESVATVFGDPPGAVDKCKNGLVRQATKLIAKSYTRARQGKEHLLPTDVATCSSKAVKACGDAPVLGVPCDGAPTLDEAGACVCAPGCAQIGAEALHGEGVDAWDLELQHAESLGYTTVDHATLCHGGPHGRILVAVLRDPSAPTSDNGITLVYADDTRFAFLARSSSDGRNSLFNSAGGVQFDSNGLPRAVGPDGAQSVATSTFNAREPRGGLIDCSGLSCPQLFLAQLTCRLDALDKAIDATVCITAKSALTVNALACVGVVGTCPGLAATGLFMVGACGEFLRGVVADAALPDLVNCENCGPKPCTGVFPCALPTGECHWGRCQPKTTLDAVQGQFCADDTDYPVCVPRPGSPIELTYACIGTDCRPVHIDCRLGGQVCVGDPGVAHCGTTTTTTTSTTTTTLPPPCQSDLDCNPGATGQGLDPDDDCVWNKCDLTVGCVDGLTAHSFEYEYSGCEDGVPCTVGSWCNGIACVGWAQNASNLNCNEGNPSNSDPDADCLYHTCIPIHPQADGKGCVQNEGVETPPSPCVHGDQPGCCGAGPSCRDYHCF